MVVGKTIRGSYTNALAIDVPALVLRDKCPRFDLQPSLVRGTQSSEEKRS
jgi:hypothetical protein